MADNPELLPCPFCGGKELTTEGCLWYQVVYCLTCEAEGPVADALPNPENAIAAWNRRAPDPQSAAEPATDREPDPLLTDDGTEVAL
jgi:Lar family restriction alleviation protein